MEESGVFFEKLWYHETMKIGFVSLGCAKNLVDSEELMGRVRALGHTLTGDVHEAEVIVINTCGFIESAKEESINTILEMAEYKEENLRYLIVCGCLSQRYKKELEAELPEVDRFITITEYPQFEDILSEVLHTSNVVTKKAERVLTTQPWTAYLRIGDGCSNRCTYCAIPLIRGPFSSVPEEDLIQEAEYLASKGVKELVLIAQDTTRYGYDWDGKLHLLSLLKKLNAMEAFHWIRVLYMYPDEIPEELIYGMKELDKVVPYFDIPMQHGSNKMLKLMNRRGTKESVTKLCKLIRENFKHSTLRTTMIVGFPQETEEDFEELLDFVRENRWDRLGAFTYSKEEDTAAYDMEGQIDEDVKKERLDRLMSLQQVISQENSEKLIGETLEVLVEGYDAIKDLYRGRSKLSAPDGVDGIVYIRSNEGLTFGEFYNVKILEAKAYDLVGELA